jgi:hypothetical protein
MGESFVSEIYHPSARYNPLSAQKWRAVIRQACKCSLYYCVCIPQKCRSASALAICVGPLWTMEWRCYGWMRRAVYHGYKPRWHHGQKQSLVAVVVYSLCQHDAWLLVLFCAPAAARAIQPYPFIHCSPHAPCNVSHSRNPREKELYFSMLCSTKH